MQAQSNQLQNGQLQSGQLQKSREQGFVELAIDRCQADKGMAARLRRADNPATEYQCWEFLGWFGIDLENDHERLPYITLAAAIARSKAERNGQLTLGAAILMAYDNDRESPQAKARLRRLLACQTQTEACRILRPLLMLIQSKVIQPLDFVRVLKQLRYFNHKTKIQWAQEFYGQNKEKVQ